MRIKKIAGSVALAAVLFTGCGGGGGDSSTAPAGISTANKAAALTTYAIVAEKNYAQALTDAIALKRTIDTFAATQTQPNLDAAKAAWKTSRNSYGTTEIFRLSNGPIDGEELWIETLYGNREGQINAWPLDENMIDYTQPNSSTARTTGNIIDSSGNFTPSNGDAVDVSTITTAVLSALNENGGDANVATGYHAIEFLLWGQDQDYNNFLNDTITNGATAAGSRPLADFTTEPNAARRLDYLTASAELLVEDLTAVANAWKSSSANCTSGVGCYRAAFLNKLTGADASKNISTAEALKQVFAGMGVFIKSELANERMAVAVLTPSEEDEHSCFSDNTHVDIDKNYHGFVNALKGTYNGSQGTSFYSLLSAEQKAELDTKINAINAQVAAINAAASTEHFDYQIKPGSANKQNIIDAKNALRDLGDEMVDVAAEFGISLDGNDVTDPDETPL